MRMGRSYSLGLWIGLAALGVAGTMRAQNFGSLIVNRKKIELARKLPPQGHIEGTSFKVEATAPSGVQSDVATDLKSTLESVLVRNDSRLRTEDEGRPDTLITCKITSYAQPPPQTTSQAALGGKSGVQNEPMERVTGVLTVSFQAKDEHGGRSLAADNVTAKFDQEYSASGAQQGVVHSVTHTFSHLTKGGSDDDTPPTAVELHNRLVQDAAMQIASHLVNTTEQVEIYLAKGGGLDQADKLMDSKLWTRALEQLETMKPFDKPEDDAYRLYDLGVVNEALAYEAEDIQKARKYLQEASIDYGKAIDGKPTEKYFLQPQTRIDTALAHYKVLGDQKTTVASAAEKSAGSGATATSASGGSESPDVLTNDGVISMVAAKLDEANVIDTIQHAPAVHFDLSAQGQVDLAKNNVSGKIITAMKTRARAPVTHHVATTSGKPGG